MTNYKENYYEMGSKTILKEAFVFDELYKEKMSYTELVDFIVKNPEVMSICNGLPFTEDARVVFETTLRNPKVKFYSSVYLRSPILQETVLLYETIIRNLGNRFLDEYAQDYLRSEAGRNYCSYEEWERFYDKKVKETFHKSWASEYAKDGRLMAILIKDDSHLECIPANIGKSKIKEMKLIRKNLDKLGIIDSDDIIKHDVEGLNDDFATIADEVKMDEFYKIMPQISDFYFGSYLSKKAIDRYAEVSNPFAEEKVK